MSVAKKITNKKKENLVDVSRIKLNFKEKFADPKIILDELAILLKEGDFAASTDLISAYVTYSSQYKNQDEFAAPIGTTRQTLHRMFAHENVSMNVFFGALEKIFKDSQK